MYLFLTDVEQRDTRAGKPYLRLSFLDAEGDERPGVWWSQTLEKAGIAKHKVYRVAGRMDEYKGTPQIVVSGMEEDLEGNIPPETFLPRSSYTRSNLRLLIGNCMADVGPVLRTVYENIMGDDDFGERFFTCPGASGMHHAWIGGLAEHTLGVMSIADAFVTELEGNPNIDIGGKLRDLVTFGAFVHDIDKIFEYDPVPGFPMTTWGKMHGHAGAVHIRPYLEGLDGDLRDRILHVVASHHGKREWGAAVEPCTLEAWIVHWADLIDSRTAGMVKALMAVPEGEEWTASIPILGGAKLRSLPDA